MGRVVRSSLDRGLNNEGSNADRLDLTTIDLDGGRSMRELVRKTHEIKDSHENHEPALPTPTTNGKSPSDSTGNTCDDSKNVVGKKPGKKKKIKSPFSGLKTSRVIGTAIAAMTTSIISTHFLSTMNSIIVLAMTSIITTFSIELWSTTVKQTGKATAKVAEKIPYDKILPKTIASSIDEKLDSVLEETIVSNGPLVKAEELQAIKKALIEDPDINIQLKTDSGNSDKDITDSTDAGRSIESYDNDDSTDKASTNDSVVETVDQSDDTDSEDGTNGSKNRVFAALDNIFALNGDSNETRLHKIMQMFLLFLIVSTLTIGGIWIGESVFNKQAVTNVYQTTSLSDKDKKTILDETNALIDSKMTASASKSSNNEQTANTAGLEKRLSSLESTSKTTAKTLESLQSQLDSISKSSSSPSPSASPTTQSSGSTDSKDYDSQIQDLKSQITSLNTQLSNMQSEISSLKTQVGENASSSSSSNGSN